MADQETLASEKAHLSSMLDTTHQHALERRVFYQGLVTHNPLVEDLLLRKSTVKEGYERLENLVMNKSEDARALYSHFSELCQALTLPFPDSYEACAEEIRIRKSIGDAPSGIGFLLTPLGAIGGFVMGAFSGMALNGMGVYVPPDEWLVYWSLGGTLLGTGGGAGLMSYVLHARKKYTQLPLRNYTEALFAVQEDIDRHMLFVEDALTRNKSLNDFTRLLQEKKISADEFLYYKALLYHQFPGLRGYPPTLLAEYSSASLEEKTALVQDLTTALQAMLQDLNRHSPEALKELERDWIAARALPAERTPRSG